MHHTFSPPLFHMIVRALVLVILVFSTGVGGIAHAHAASIATPLHTDMLSISDEAGTPSGISDHISTVGHCPGLAGICFAIASNSTDLPSSPSASRTWFGMKSRGALSAAVSGLLRPPQNR